LPQVISNQSNIHLTSLTKWDLIKVLGNDTQFRIWIEGFFLQEGVLMERLEGGHYYYRKTERGELLHY